MFLLLLSWFLLLLSLSSPFISNSWPVLVMAADGTTCACGGGGSSTSPSSELPRRPDVSAKAETARWMARVLDWGVLSTISTRLEDGDSIPIPFGNVYSFVDGTCAESKGVPYVYGTYLDQSFIDTKHNPKVSLTLSEASLSSVCASKHGLDSCTLNTKYGDPENPVCARLTLTGTLVVLDSESDSDEYNFAKEALFERHSTMESWPTNHEWVVAKLEIEDIWLIDFFGGAAIIDPETYFGVSLLPSTSSSSSSVEEGED